MLVRVRETWRQIMAKCVLQVTGKEATATCVTEQLVGGVEAVIEGFIHDMRFLWAHQSQDGD